MNVRAVLFDVDGTLLDTREFIFAAYEHTTRALGIPTPSRAELAREVGRPLEEIYVDLAGPAADGAIDIHRSFQRENLHLARPFPGAAETLAALRAEGMRLAAVTSRSRRTSMLTLELAGLDGHLDAVISAEDAPALKPDPAPLLLALERLSAGSDGATMVGDAHQDIAAGKAIGAVTVAATYGFHGAALLESTPDYAIDSIGALVDRLGAGAGHRSA